MKMPHWPKMLGRKEFIPSLDRINKIVEKLGNPHLSLPPVIHVAGTNGKGSTIAFMQAIFTAAGYRVHKYTSPHLLNFTERIMLNNHDIRESKLYDLLEECRIVSEKYGLEGSFFDWTTAAAMLAFSRHSADILLLETGMGGRLDPTNIIANPIACVITPISYDHVAQLGNSLEKIAAEKAGILKANAKFICALQHDSVLHVLYERAQSMNMKSEIFSYDFFARINETSKEYKRRETLGDIEEYNDERRPEGDWDFCARSLIKRDVDNARDNGEYICHMPKPSLRGFHQYVNASTAIATVRAVSEHYPNITEEHIRCGIANALWPSRIERIETGALVELMPEESELYIDGAHNNAGAQTLAKWLEEQSDDLSSYLVVGLTKNRDPYEILTPFKGVVVHIYGVKVVTEPSSSDASVIKQAADSLGFNGAQGSSIGEIVERINADQKGVPYRLVITGSLFLTEMLHGENRG